ncbi:hypothetical protein KFE25_009902 [Diacronema lutheri]|uniref:Uncharacterized protein n=1 Tax=Diacronema lutheri TaxID=2081491 RepID=A0A8J5XJ19_DIALT|nr:hypothetical protein KFE25_009902 [Diacronema lutheri]
MFTAFRALARALTEPPDRPSVGAGPKPVDAQRAADAPPLALVAANEAAPSEPHAPRDLPVVEAVTTTAPAGSTVDPSSRKRARKAVVARPDPKFGVVGPSAVWTGSAWAVPCAATRASAIDPPDALGEPTLDALALVAAQPAAVAKVAEVWPWWVPADVCKADLLAAYTWELAQALKQPLVQPFHFQAATDRSTAPKHAFARNYAKVLSIGELDAAARHFRPPVQQMLDALGAVLRDVPQQVVPVILRAAGLIPADSWIGLSELRDIFAPVCLLPPEVGSDGKLRIALPKDAGARPKGKDGALLVETVDRWRMRAPSKAWAVDSIPRAGERPPLGTRLIYPILLAEARLTQRAAERILGLESVDPTRPHLLEIMVRARTAERVGLDGGVLLSRTRALCMLTVAHDAPVSVLAKAVASEHFTDAFTTSGRKKRRESATVDDEHDEPRAWTTLVVVDKSPYAMVRDELGHVADLVISDHDRARALRSCFGHYASSRFALTEVRVHLAACERTGQRDARPELLGSLSALVSQRVHAALDAHNVDSLASCEEAGGAETGAVRLDVRLDCALADLLPRVDERAPPMRAYLREGSERRCLAVTLHSTWGDEADIFVLRRVRARGGQQPAAGAARAVSIASVHATPQHIFM